MSLFRSLLLVCLALLPLGAQARCADKVQADTLVLTTTPQMHCESCETRIKQALRFVKGTRRILTSVPEQTVTIVFDARKAGTEAYRTALWKIGYESRVVRTTVPATSQP